MGGLSGNIISSTVVNVEPSVNLKLTCRLIKSKLNRLRRKERFTTQLSRKEWDSEECLQCQFTRWTNWTQPAWKSRSMELRIPKTLTRTHSMWTCLTWAVRYSFNWSEAILYCGKWDKFNYMQHSPYHSRYVVITKSALRIYEDQNSSLGQYSKPVLAIPLSAV